MILLDTECYDANLTTRGVIEKLSNHCSVQNEKVRIAVEEFGTLVKFGKQDHLLQLQDEGLLYLNNLPYFWEIED